MWAMTYRCNMSCSFCFLRNKVCTNNEMSSDEILVLAENIATNTQWKPDAIWLTGGEPTIIESLPEVVGIFEKSGIRSIITTNGLCNNNSLNQIISSNPKGITVSLEVKKDNSDVNLRDFRDKVLTNIQQIAKDKSDYTTLGVSCVLFPDIITSLSDFAKEMKELGVEYLSVNPVIGHRKPYTYTLQDFNELESQIKYISAIIGLRMPSQFFFSLVKDYYLSCSKKHLKCPAGSSFYFISPWGEWLPCSDERWQQGKEINQYLSTQVDFNLIQHNLESNYYVSNIFTDSECFSDRCIGCWKLYYDTIFTNNS